MKLAVAAILACLAAAATSCSRERPAEPPANATPSAPTAATSSNTSSPRRPSVAAKTIAMPADATVLTIKGTLDAGKDAEYVIGEEKGSVFMAHALTPEQDLDVAIYRADTGERVADQQPSNPAFFMARLPETLGYLVVVRSTGAASPYELQIEVPRRLSLDPKTNAADIATTLPANAVVAYLIPPGFPISANLTKAPADAYLAVHGLAGQPLLKAEAGARTFSGAAPQPNEELVVIVNQGASDGDVALKVQRK